MNPPPLENHHSSTPPKRINWGLWIFLSILCLSVAGCFMSVASLSKISVKTTSSNDMQEAVLEGKKSASDKIALIRIEGVITSQGSKYQPSMTATTIKQLKKAREDDRVKAVLLYVNTPGGEVTASDKIYNECLKIKAAGKPLIVYMDTVAASGGYYIAAAADKIIANETTITGSIGVIISGFNAQEMLKKIGVSNQTFTSGEFKDTLSMFREMRPEERAYIQSIVSDMYEKFVGIVSEGRGIPVATLKDGIADGRIFVGSRAKEVNLVDATGYLEDAIEEAKKLAELDSAKVIEFKSEPSFADIFQFIGMKAAKDDAVEVSLSELPKLTKKAFVPYYILEGY